MLSSTMKSFLRLSLTYMILPLAEKINKKLLILWVWVSIHSYQSPEAGSKDLKACSLNKIVSCCDEEEGSAQQSNVNR